MHATLPLLESRRFPALRREATTTLQVNLGYRCNQSCVHCHVNAGPNRSEMMDADTMALIPQVLAARGVSGTVGGGAGSQPQSRRWTVAKIDRHHPALGPPFNHRRSGAGADGGAG